MNIVTKSLAVSVLGLSLALFAGTDLHAALKKGDPLPSFRVKSTEGLVFNQNSFTGQTLGLVYLFKAQKCKTCIKGLEQLQGISQQFQTSLKIVAIGQEDADQLNQLAQGLGLNFPVASGDKALFQGFGAALLPTTLLVGPEGQVLKVIHGGGRHVADMITELASKELDRQNPEAARQLFSQVAGQDQGGVAQAGIAYSYLRENNLEQAEQAFRQMATSRDPQAALRGQEGLAEVYFRRGKTQEAMQTAQTVLSQDPNRSMANLTMGKSLHAAGKPQEAQQALVLASADQAQSDFAWQRAEANLALGNLQMQGQAGQQAEPGAKAKNSRIALKSYRKAAQENPYFAEALSNEGVALQNMGEPEQAVEVFQRLQQVNPTDKLVHSLLRQAQEAIAQKQDLERRRYIDGLVGDLVKQFRENKVKQPAHPADDWTSPPLAVSILGFQNNTDGGGLTGRIGMEGILQDELTRELQTLGVHVVDRALLDQLLEELKLGSSDLADPDTALKLGRLMAARIITTGSFFSTHQGTMVSMRMIDTETTNIVLSLSDKKQGEADPTVTAPKFAKAIQGAIKEHYPLKGRLAMVEDDMIVINLGKKHGVQVDQVFNVMGEGKPIELNGRILGYRPAKLGSLKVTQVDDLMAYATPVEKTGTWEKNQKIIEKK